MHLGVLSSIALPINANMAITAITTNTFMPKDEPLLYEL